jgi:hypothetical protein
VFKLSPGFDALVKNPMVDASMVALIGYCFGGAVGVEFGATGAPLVANVSIHGSFRDHEAGWAKKAKGMYLILHGAEDESYPLTTVDRVIQELRASKVPFQLEVWHRPRLLHPEEQGGGARQRAVDRLDRTNAQGAFRYLSAGEMSGAISPLTLGHHGPGHSGEFIGKRDRRNLGWSPHQQCREPWSMFAAVGLGIADDRERAGHKQAA